MSVTPIVSAEAIRRCEEANFAARGADPLQLMQIAGRGCAERFADFFTALPNRAKRRIVILSGHGNNGGDGIVMARILAEELLPGVPVEIQFTLPENKLSPAAAYYFAQLPREVRTSMPSSPVLPPGSVIVDALLGTGIKPPLRAPYGRWISAVNASGLPVFAVDLPSGLGSGCGISADYTATIGYFKDALFSDEGIESAGRLSRVPLPLPLGPELPPETAFAADAEFYRQTERPLPAAAHKYSRGSVLIAGGSADYPNAPVLSSLAALRTGAGLVTLALPEGMERPARPLALIARNLTGTEGAFSADSLAEVTALSEKTSAIAVGPGLGRKDDTLDFVRGALALPQPLVLDADALYFAAQIPGEVAGRNGISVLTPHAGEAARLAEAVGIAEKSRPALARKLAEHFHSVVVLKGPRSVIAAPGDEALWFNTSGTPALATAGSGDVLTGMIAAELAARRPTTFAEAKIAAARAVFLHGMAGELATEQFSTDGVLADDLPDFAAKARRLCRMR